MNGVPFATENTSLVLRTFVRHVFLDIIFSHSIRFQVFALLLPRTPEAFVCTEPDEISHAKNRRRARRMEGETMYTYFRITYMVFKQTERTVSVSTDNVARYLYCREDVKARTS